MPGAPPTTGSESTPNAALKLFDLSGRLALITGSSQGIGLALARGLGQAGARVVLNGRDGARLEHARALLESEGLAASATAFDVTDRAAARDAVAAIERDIAPIDIL